MGKCINATNQSIRNLLYLRQPILYVDEDNIKVIKDGEYKLKETVKFWQRGDQVDNGPYCS
ncbi:hypothetical protein KP509_23G055000 [Ceratopteris richardii]|uniref:Uncharacterized protein n=1 Tax=Ceratopteris richardii TaxID=49495 RepID=A0A8T2S2N6_CERRI|nr:hypothetical protein KP509_23G055000 [Ceratopteris richardii]